MYPKRFWSQLRLPKLVDKVFVGMWFDDDNIEKRYDSIIKKAIEQANLKPLFLKDIITGDSIPIDIMSGIIECKLVLFEISPMDVKTKLRNSNVMYELGLAHAWRNKEEVIILRDDDDKLPFDIQAMGVVKYTMDDTNYVIDEIKNTILFRLQEIKKSQKSMVRKAAENLNIQAYSILMASKGRMFHDARFTEIDKILAIPLLLNLGLIEMLTDGHGYGYHPTQLGREVISYYGQSLGEDDIKDYKTLDKKDYE